jgi:predicted transcriptional regulator
MTRCGAAGFGVVYGLTVADVESLHGLLAARGHDVAVYHGQLDAEARERVESRLKANTVKAVVATSALGMGFDKPDLAFCLHLGSPGSPVDYYQQVGRAGRALDSAVVALLPGAKDEKLWQWFATSNVPKPEQARAVLRALAEHGEPVSVITLEADTGIRRTTVELLVKVLAVDGAVVRETGVGAHRSRLGLRPGGLRLAPRVAARGGRPHAGLHRLAQLPRHPPSPRARRRPRRRRAVREVLGVHGHAAARTALAPGRRERGRGRGLPARP